MRSACSVWLMPPSSAAAAEHSPYTTILGVARGVVQALAGACLCSCAVRQLTDSSDLPVRWSLAFHGEESTCTTRSTPLLQCCAANASGHSDPCVILASSRSILTDACCPRQLGPVARARQDLRLCKRLTARRLRRLRLRRRTRVMAVGPLEPRPFPAICSHKPSAGWLLRDRTTSLLDMQVRCNHTLP